MATIRVSYDLEVSTEVSHLATTLAHVGLLAGMDTHVHGQS